MSSTPPSTSSDGNAVDFGISAAEILAARGGNGLRSERGGWRGRGRGRGGSRGVPGGHIDSIPSYSGSTLSSDFAEHTTPHQSQPAQPEPHITLTTEENSTGAHPQHTYAIEDDNVELIMDPNSIRKASEGVTWRKILAAYKFEDAEITTIVRRLSLRKISEVSTAKSYIAMIIVRQQR